MVKRSTQENIEKRIDNDTGSNPVLTTTRGNTPPGSGGPAGNLDVVKCNLVNEKTNLSIGSGHH